MKKYKGIVLALLLVSLMFTGYSCVDRAKCIETQNNIWKAANPTVEGVPIDVVKQSALKCDCDAVGSSKAGACPE